MEISPYMLLLLLIYSLLFGMSAGVFNDLNRIVRAFFGVRYSGRSFEKLYEMKLPFVGCLAVSSEGKTIKKGLLSLLIFFQDILLFAFLGCGTVILNYYLNRGQFRLYTIAAVAVGFAVYYFTLGRLVIFLSEAIIFFVRASVRIIFYIVSRPFVFAAGLLARLFKIIWKKIVSALAKRQMIRYNKKRQTELLEMSRRGFLE